MVSAKFAGLWSRVQLLDMAGFFRTDETQIGPDHSLALETQRVACVWVATRDTTHPSLSRESVGLVHLQSVRGEAAIEREAALLLRGKRDVVALFKVRTHLPLRPRQLWALCITVCSRYVKRQLLREQLASLLQRKRDLPSLWS